MALRGAGKSNPLAIVDPSEYLTVFLEDIVKLLGNRRYFVSRSISLENVESLVVNCAITPLQKFAMDKLSAYFMEMKKLLSDVIDTGNEYLPLGEISCCSPLGGRVRSSCSLSVKKHIQRITNNANYSDTFEWININTVAMASSLSRMTEEEGKALAFEDTKVFENRPHSLGRVRPPDPKSIASTAIQQGEGLANIGFIREAIGKIQLENGTFERENGINKRLIRFDDKGTSVPGVMYAQTPGKDRLWPDP
ncbi:hypothetical protein O3P69_006696 [Scylla paramamosain]|uniref:Uncharacterized protein n=1 Tax=Scylla paramamosain TaxID=85552 RepID=A0AAW0U1G4_SCYPA